MFELFCVLSYRFVPLSQLQKFHLFSILDVVREVLREKLPPKDIPSNWFLSLLHDGLHTDPLVFSLTREHVHREGQPTLLGAHLSIKYSLDVFQSLTCDIWTGLSIELDWIVLHEVFKLHSRWRGLGSGPWAGAVDLFSSNWRKASMCCLWASSAANLAASIYCITNFCCSRDVVWRCIDVSCYCIILVFVELRRPP